MAATPGAATAETLCHVADPQDQTVNVRKTPAGAVVGQLPNERVVRIDATKPDAQGRPWAEVSGSDRGDYKIWGWVIRDRLRCVDTKSFPREKLSVDVLRSAGIVPQNAWDSKNNRSGRMLPVSCDEIPNGWGVTLSNELFEEYRRRGFSRSAVCLALGGNDIHFDPQTGQRLNLYEIPDDIFGLRPAWLPDCYKSVQVVRKSGYLVAWRPTGCTIRFHPSTGLPIKNAAMVEVTAGGEAGGGVDEDNRSSTVSKDRARALVRGR
jgi:hypothetical protein